MKVGIYFSGNLQDCGGGYTYEQEVFHSFLSLASTSHHTYVIFSQADLTDLMNDDSKKNIQCVRIPKIGLLAKILEHLYLSSNGPFFNYIYFNYLPFQTAIRKHRIDLMVFLNWKHPLVDIPSITPVWDLQHRLQPWFPEVSANGEWENREKYYQKVLGRSSIILTGTSEGQDEIAHLYNVPENRIEIIPLPTPSDVLSCRKGKNKTDIEKFRFTGDYLLYPAQFWPHKNHKICIQALDILRHQYQRDVALVFVGSDKNNLSYLREYAEHEKISEYVHFLGFVSREDLIALYQNAFALVFPTFFGPDNIPPLEAFALRYPVIASKVPGADEQLGEAALLFNPQNPQDLADAINLLFSNPSVRDNLIEKGFVRAGRWTSDDYVRKIFSLLDEFEPVRQCWK